MSSAKPIQGLRIQTLVANSPGTPLRRRSALNVSVNVASPFEASRHINDDEEERRNSRRFEPVDSGINIAEESNNLTNCLKLFAENKISKDNAWTLNIIDSFSNLIKKHHHSLSNFQVAGSTLEASTKVYSLRVDSVYADVLRMSTDLSKQTAKALSKKNRLNADEEDSDREEGDNDKENQNATMGTQEGGSKSPKEKQKKKRRHVATVTKNPDTLNGRLDTHPLVDPFFAKLNSMVGDINSSKRLMQNIIPTKDSNLKLRQNLPMWDKSDSNGIDLDLINDFKARKEECALVTITSVTPNIDNYILRAGLRSYRICDLPMENAEEADMSIRNPHDDGHNQTIIGRNHSNMDLQFDINAEVEPIPLERSFVMDFGDMNDNDFDDVEEDQRLALNRCKGLKRQPILIEDMQPETSAALSDYSYRPLDNIDQFWAGPSHWKFRQSRRTHAMSLARVSASSMGTIPETQANQRPRAIRKKKIIRRVEVTLEEALNVDEYDTLYTQKGRSKNTQITLQVMAKRWDNKKWKLPIDHRIPSDILDNFDHASSIHIQSNPDATFTGTDNGDNYNYDNDDDRNYCSRVDIQSDTETETNTDMGQDVHAEFDPVEMGAPAIPQIDEIPDFFVGAPDRIEKISIAFAKRAKVVDMKQMKQCSWNIISKRNATNPLDHPHFSDVLRDLPKTLSKTMAENMSLPLAFYATLHLCNDKGLKLKSDEDLRDFEIFFVND